MTLLLERPEPIRKNAINLYQEAFLAAWQECDVMAAPDRKLRSEYAHQAALKAVRNVLSVEISEESSLALLLDGDDVTLSA
jgi:cation transport regulator ChaB